MPIGALKVAGGNKYLGNPCLRWPSEVIYTSLGREGLLSVISGIFYLALLLGPSDPEGAWKVKVYGALREIMHQADISERVKLADLGGEAGMYGLGAVADLKGEIIILDGNAYVSRVEDGLVSVKKASSQGAALLVTAHIAKWQAMPIPPQVKGLGDLAKFLETSAKRIGLDPAGPFPFQVKGHLKSVSWHVIDWPDGDTEHTHEKHKNSGARGDLADSMVTLLGFFSDHHQGRFTHHTTSIHVHVRSDDGALAGHVDGLNLGDGAVLLLPDTR